jgi:hypothetical protein
MSGFFQNLLKDAAGGFFGSDYLRDYTHASKTFGTNLYQYSPKFKFLFHCYFSINNDVYDLDKQQGTQQNFGLLVRDVKLPAYQIQTTQMNQYNRKRIVQTKIKYEPVNFTFFDDNSNTMAKLWAAYYTYYYNDGSIPLVKFSGRGGNGLDLTSAAKEGTVRGLAGAGGVGSAPEQDEAYTTRNIYENDISKTMFYGYNVTTNNGEGKPNFFNNITIYGFYQKNFIAYTLINPVITNFAHDTYNYDEGTGIMKNTMTIDYETVVYNEGKMDGEKPQNIVPGFGDEATYDRTLSPIAMPGSNGKVLGNGGLIDSVGGALGDFSSNPLGSIRTLGASYKTFKNTDLTQSLKTELTNSFVNNLRQKPNETRNLSFSFDNPGSGPQAPTGAGAPVTGQVYGTDSAPNTNSNNGTNVRVNAQGNPILTLANQLGDAARNVGNAIVRTATGAVPDRFKESPAGKQSTSGATTLPGTSQPARRVGGG